jgi:hypothetical protein
MHVDTLFDDARFLVMHLHDIHVTGLATVPPASGRREGERGERNEHRETKDHSRDLSNSHAVRLASEEAPLLAGDLFEARA